MVGVLGDDTDPMVTVMKLEKAPQETYADIGGLDQQIQGWVHLPSLPDLKSDLSRISSNLTGFTTESWRNLPKWDSIYKPNPPNLD